MKSESVRCLESIGGYSSKCFCASPFSSHLVDRDLLLLMITALSSNHRVFTNLFRKRSAIIEVPTKVADQYSHKLPNESTSPETKAGAKERAGFMDAPEIKDIKKMSKPTMPPITIPLNPFSPLAYTTVSMTAIRRADAN